VAGRFFVIDGPDGAGKTTQAARLARHLEGRGERAVVLREPGATPAGEAIRDLLLDPDTDVTPLAEMLLYQAARAQIVETIVRPQLEAGAIVILDRYCYATAAYQGHGLGLDVEDIRRVSAVATGGLEPDHVFVLDVDPETGLGRLARAPDRIEARPVDYHRRVRDGFLAEARRLGSRATVVDGRRPVGEVAEEIRARVDALCDSTA
jgi:dTMP kinase